jgi:hypothetical protein
MYYGTINIFYKFFMYVNFVTYGFKGSMPIISILQYCNMFCMMHINVYIFPVLAPFVKKNVMVLLDFCFSCIKFIHNNSLFIIKLCHLWCNFFIWNTFINLLTNMHYQIIFWTSFLRLHMVSKTLNHMVQLLSCL